MSEKELHAKVKQLCDDTEFLFATSGLVDWNITNSKNLYDLSEYIRTIRVEDAENKCINENSEKDFFNKEIDKIDAEIIKSFDKYQVEKLIKNNKNKELMKYVNDILSPLIEKKKELNH